MSNNTDDTGPKSNLPSRCKNCGASLEADEWYPIESAVPDSGDPQVFVFCDETCYEEWTAK